MRGDVMRRAALIRASRVMAYAMLDARALGDWNANTARAATTAYASGDALDATESFFDGFSWQREGRFGMSYDVARRAFAVFRERDDESVGVTRARTGERAYDAAISPNEDVFAATARDAPTTTRRADGDGEIVASYVSVDRRSDEPRSACGVGYVCGGTMLACGVDGAVDVFDVTRPGRTPAMRAETRSRDDLDGGGQRGLVSCVDACPTENHLFCAGSYAGGRDAIDCGVYDARAEGGRACSWSARGGGVTQVRWSVDGNFIYTASRRSDDILCVDVRNTLGVVYALKRAAHGTNQRIRFDLEPCGAHLVTGGVDGFVRAFDLRTGEEVGRTQVSPNGACVNAVSFHPYSCAVAGSSEKFRRLACVVGERVFVDVSGDDSDSDDSDDSDAVKRNDFGVSFWDYPTIEASWA